MKAILVIDVQMTEDGKHSCNSCPVWDEKICGCKHDFMTGHKGCPLKPMPQKKSHIEGSWNAEKIEITNDFEDGWNACLKEITDESRMD